MGVLRVQITYTHVGTNIQSVKEYQIPGLQKS